MDQIEAIIRALMAQRVPTPQARPIHDPTPWDTDLTVQEDAGFPAWREQYVDPRDSGWDYDLRGAYKAGFTPGPDGHWFDTFKKPNHPTFSDESQYAVGNMEQYAGSWDENDQFIPPVGHR